MIASQNTPPGNTAGRTPEYTRRVALASLGILVFLVFLELLLYTLIHEGGHALVGLLFGGRITAFSANFLNLSGHVGIDGTFSPAQNALISAAGPSLPPIACLGFLLLAPRRGNTVLEWFKLLLFLGSANALLAWIVIPWLVQAGHVVADDSANFMGYTRVSPLVESGAALLVYLACWAVFLFRVGGLQGLVGRFRGWPEDLLGPASRRTMLSLVGVGAVALAAALTLTAAYPDRRYQAPPDYQPVSAVDLAASKATGSVYEFSLEKPSRASFFFSLQNVRGGPVKIWLAGPAGYENVFFTTKDPKFTASKASVNPQALELAAGNYQVHIAAPASSGSVSISSRIE